MKTIQTQMDVPGTGILAIPVPLGISEGKHNVIVIIDEIPLQQKTSSLDDFPVDSVGQWPDHLSLTREDVYSDNGR